MGQPRFYLDVGSNDGEELSNTKALDDQGWKGICVDPFPKNFEKRTCNLHRRAVASSKRNVTFVIADVLSGITDHLDTFKEATKDSDRVVLETALLHDLLEESNAPPFIDYFSLDTEGTLLEFPHFNILAAF
ncbi:hypothetical protein WJX75_008386 [Coccomyxa subellipsoidea]|uniref:Methyltransferase FkbM domain-containing protein n=1 Tax=Coccomyxa subellipsoidea TaxID=248742 RepID=A0ABR2Z460_9CHLO